MRPLLAACIVLCASIAMPDAAFGAGVLQRYVLAAGVNNGGRERPRLQYAVSDAQRFARVLADLGGVSPDHEIVLKEPTLRDFLHALDQISARVNDAGRAAAGNGGGRAEVVLYYSGHADEKGLLLGDDRYSYESLRERLDQIQADVRIAILDACASGAFIRIKGGKTRPAFLVDQSSSMRGHAFLTSSSETEAAQESDRIGASYFTHYLVSGLRGAADTSGDGKITLNEAYQFAFNETLGRTEQSRGGAQHPSYEITMSGTGEVVMTDVRQTSATLVLGEEMAGRFFVRNAAQQLVVELYKPAGRRVELGLEPGTYEVRLEREGGGSFAGKTQVGEGGRVALDAALFHPTTPEPTRTRGVEARSFAVAGRNRIEMRFRLRAEGSDLGAGLLYTRYLRENLALTAGFGGISMSAAAFDTTSSIWSFPLELRWNPMRGDLTKRAVKPYLAFGLGPVVGTYSHYGESGNASTTVTLEGQVGAGVDVQVARSWTVGFSLTHMWVGDLPRSFAPFSGANGSFNGTDFVVGIGWLFGRGRGPR